MAEPTGDIVSSAVSGLCELANQSRLGIPARGLKETAAKTEHFRQRRITRAPALDRIRKHRRFL